MTEESLPTYPDIKEVAEVFAAAGAVRILAHPFGPDTPADEAQRNRLETWLDRYADGLELYRPYENPAYQALIREIVTRRKRPFTGGSDRHSHGEGEKKISRAPYACLDSLREFKATGKVEQARPV